VHIYQVRIHCYLSFDYVKDESRQALFPNWVWSITPVYYFQIRQQFQNWNWQKVSQCVNHNEYLYEMHITHAKRVKCKGILWHLPISVNLSNTDQYVLTHPQDCLSSAVNDLVHQGGCPSCEDKLHPVALLKSVTKNFGSKNI
jgi:hypothetical protein